MKSFREQIAKTISKVTDLDKDDVDSLLEIPSQNLGDFAFPCFVLSKQLKKSPVEIAVDLQLKVPKEDFLEKVVANGPYLNFFIDKSQFAKSVLSKIIKDKKDYGLSKSENKKIIVEFFDANTHKGVHIGHIRNISFSESLCRIFEATGNKVIRVNYQGDIGPHVAKCLWGYINLENKKAPQSKKGTWLGRVYAKANSEITQDPKKELESKELLERIYSKEKEAFEIWQTTRKWCLDEFDEFYKQWGVHYKRFYFESEMEDKARQISKDLAQKKVAKLDDGAIIMDFKDINMSVFVLLTGDGRALYSSKDLALALTKEKEYSPDLSIIVTGKEQELHFKQVVQTLKSMGEENIVSKYKHITYGLVMLPTGKMSSREGTVVLYDELIAELISKAVAEVAHRHSDWDDNQISSTANDIAFGALKFGMLNRDNNKVILFDKEHALDLEGETGPYVQYTHARICSVLEKHKDKLSPDYSKIQTKEELALIRLLGEYPQVVLHASSEHKPLHVVKYLIELSQTFNGFYHSNPILKSEEGLRDARLSIALATKQVLQNALSLLAIPAPEKM